MKITSRLTHEFVELSVDEITTTIFKDSREIDEVIENLLEVVEDIKRLK